MRMRRAFASNGHLLMRFEGGRPRVAVKDVHETLKPRSLPPDYTPFPLPRYDPSLGFGPTRLQNIPDVAKAKVSLMEETRRINTMEAAEASVLGSMPTDAPPAVVHPAAVAEPSSNKIPSYTQQEGFPLLDRLECNRPMDELIRQFKEHPGVEGKAAAINDIASSLARFTNKELCVMFDELSATFDADGKGMNFLARRVQGYQTAFWVSSPLHWAFTGLVQDIEDHFLSMHSESEESRIGDPAVLVGMLTLFAKAKVFEPNLWHSRSSIQPSSMGSSPNPKRHNKHHAGRDLFVELFDVLQDCILSASQGSNETASPVPFLARFSPIGLAELFAALSAVHPEGIVAGNVANEILNHFIAVVEDGRSAAPDGSAREELDIAVGRMSLATTMANITNSRLDDLADGCKTFSADLLIALSRRRPLPLALVESRVREAVRLGAGCSIADAENRASLLQGACELLQAMENKEVAAKLSVDLCLGAHALQAVPYFAGVSAMLTPSGSPGPSAPASPRGKPKPGKLFLYCASLPRLRGLASVTIAHTSVMSSDITPLIHACHQLRTGRVGLLVCTQTILCLNRLALSSSKKSVRALALRALQILASEIRKGRVCLVPIEDELKIRDAAHFADEDVMVWSIAAKMVHDAPMTKVRMLVRRGHEASAPYHTLKRGSYGRFTQTHFLLNMNDALKGSQVGMGALSLNFSSRELVNQVRPINTLGKVRDQPSRVREYNPRRAHLAYRRDRPLFDKYRPHARNNALGFGRGGATEHDLRGLGIHTPDHPQPSGQLPCVASD